MLEFVFVLVQFIEDAALIELERLTLQVIRVDFAAVDLECGEAEVVLLIVVLARHPDSEAIEDRLGVQGPAPSVTIAQCLIGGVFSELNPLRFAFGPLYMCANVLSHQLGSNGTSANLAECAYLEHPVCRRIIECRDLES